MISRSVQMLSDQVINKIAAGEVVERPASVLKELMENALDAGGTQIDVEVVQGGTRLLAVSDNGCGMGRDDALLSVERHATSKICTAEDVEAVSTLGFRGEALAAVSAVSRFTLITRPARDVSGTQIQINGGRLQDVKDAGCPAGTRIEVRNLFFNVPARRRFLRAESTETAQLRQVFTVYALAHPETGLTLSVDGRSVYNLPGGASLSDRLSALYGPEFAGKLRPLEFESDEVTVSGFTGLPQTGRKDRSEQFIFINGRPASAPVIYHALNQAYHAVLARGRYPAAFLFIRTNPAWVDVNVHPAKKEVRFRHPMAVRDAVAAAVQQALVLTSPGSEPADALFRFDAPKLPPTAYRQVPLPFDNQTKPSPEAEAASLTESAFSSHEGSRSPSQQEEPPEEASGRSPTPTSGTSPWTWCRVLGQAGGRYAVLETADGLVLMDPRAAHERILFEQLMRDAGRGAIQRQGLLSPEVVRLLPAEAEMLRKNLSALDEMGFGVSDFGEDSFLVDALPVELQEESPKDLVGRIAGALEAAGSAGRAARDALRETVAGAACRSAIRQTGELPTEWLERLVDDLSRTEMPYTCPHGRPVLIFTSFAELNRKFGRSR